MIACNRCEHPVKAIASSQRLRLDPFIFSRLIAAQQKSMKPTKEKMSARSWLAPAHGRRPITQEPSTTAHPIPNRIVNS
jgi:hypothetical protein